MQTVSVIGAKIRTLEDKKAGFDNFAESLID
jgi:hypothetical protein